MDQLLDLGEDSSSPQTAMIQGGHGDAAGTATNDPFGNFDTTDKPIEPLSFDDFNQFNQFATIEQEPTPTSPEQKEPISAGEGDFADQSGNIDLLSGIPQNSGEDLVKNSNPFADQSDPFGQQLDPFNSQSDPFAQQLDPFGEQTDPFQQKSESSDPIFSEDPFNQAPAQDPFSQPAAQDPFSQPAAQDPFSQPPAEDPFSQPQPGNPFGQLEAANDPFENQKELGSFEEKDSKPFDDPFEGNDRPFIGEIDNQVSIDSVGATINSDPRRGSEIDDDLIDDIECCDSLPTTEGLKLDHLRRESQGEEHDLVKESDSWDDLQGVPGSASDFNYVNQLAEELLFEPQAKGAIPQSTVEIKNTVGQQIIEQNLKDYAEEIEAASELDNIAEMSKAEIVSELDDLTAGFDDQQQPAHDDDQVVNGSVRDHAGGDTNGVDEPTMYNDDAVETEAKNIEDQDEISFSKQLQQQEDSKTDPQKTKDEKKAMEYMKERYEETGEKGHTKIIRQPKKLDNKWEKKVEEEVKSPTDKERHALPKEQDLVSYTAIPIDYSKSKYEEKVNKGQTSPTVFDPKLPVNKRPQPVKVAPPAITQNLKSLFESGEFTDLHNPKKAEIHIAKRGSGVHENEPVQLEGVVRESDFDTESESVEKGYTNNLIEEWKMKGKDEKKKVVKKPIKINKEGKGPAVLENKPKVRKDVVRETDENDKLPESGVAKMAKEKLVEKTTSEEVKVKEPIELPPARPGTVFENEPLVRDDVVREDSDTNAIAVETGKAKNLAGFWANQSDDVKLEKKSIVIDRESAPTVLENEPIVLEGVVRSSDQDATESAIELEEGRTKNLAGYWKNRVTEDEKPLKPKEPIKLDIIKSAPAVIENEPAVRDDVVRCNESQEDVIPGEAGRTKNLASRFLNQEDDSRKGPKDMIVIDRSGGAAIIENEPVSLNEDVVRSEPVSKAAELESGHTKNLLSHWVKQEEDAAMPKTSTSKVALENNQPLWVAEIANAKDSGVYENEPEKLDNVAREYDVLESPDMLEEDNTKIMRNRWKQLEANAQDDKSNPPQLIRFTPPREMTPPHIYQTDYQSFQQITLCQPTSPTEDQSFDTSEIEHASHAADFNKENKTNGDVQHPYTNMNGHIDNDTVDIQLPVTPVKSSAVLVLK